MISQKDRLAAFAAEVMDLGVTLFEKMGPDKIMPTWVAQSHGDDAWDIGTTPWSDNTEKKLYVAVVKEHFAQIKAVRYALLSETWIISRKLDEEVEVPPCEADDRRETLVVLAEDYKDSIMLTREIVRPSEGKPYLKEVDTVHMKRKDASGLMTGMLPEAEGVALQ